MVEPKTPEFRRLGNSSGEWTCTRKGIRTTDQTVMSKDPESVPFVRRVLQISQTDERWFSLARPAAIPQGDTVVDRCAYSSPITWVRQGHFLVPF